MSPKIDGRTREGRAVKKAIKALDKALHAEYEAVNGIRRGGKQIVIPEHLNMVDAANAMLAQAKELEEEIQTSIVLDGHPDDSMVCFTLAMQDAFGKLLPATAVQTIFGPMHQSRTLTIPVDHDETLQVPVGKLDVPGLPLEIEVAFNKDPYEITKSSVQILFTHKRKYLGLVKDIEQMTRDRLANQSIFKGKAIQSNFEFINVSGLDESRVIYGRDEAALLDGELFSYIRHREQQKQAGNNLKRGVLLYGPYGTGKTLTSLLTGKIAVENGWTFMNVRPGDSISSAINFAKNYQPAVVFFEDIDQDTQGERDSSVNEILNTMDGALSKNSEVIVVMTTNHIGRVNRAMLRPGRLDAVLEIGILDIDSVREMVSVLLTDAAGESRLDGELDIEAIYDAAEGYPPAFVAEGVAKAKSYAIASGNGHEVSSQDIVNGLKSLRSQFDMMLSDQEQSPPAIDTHLRELVDETVTESLREMSERVDYIYDQM